MALTEPFKSNTNKPLIMSQEHSISPLLTSVKGLVGTGFAILSPTAWVDPSKAMMGVLIPALTLVSLYYDLRRKRRIEAKELAELQEAERQKRIREQREAFFRNKRFNKKKNKGLTSSDDSVSI